MNRQQFWAVVGIVTLLALTAYATYGLYRLIATSPPPITEIHIEALSNDTYFQNLKAFISKRDVTLMVMVPQTNLTRLTNLLPYTDIGLHIHIAVKPEIDSVPYEKQLQLITEGKATLENLIGLEITRYAPGYWSYNEDTVRAVSEAGLEYFHVWKPQLMDGTEELCEKYGLEFVVVENYTHDWELGR